MPQGIFGGIFDQNVHLRDSRHAAEAYGFNKADLSNGTPRHKFEFFIRINFNRDLDTFVRKFLDKHDQEIFTTMVKHVSMPSMDIDTDVLNQYNKKRVIQSRINYNPVNITLHDSVEGRVLRFWEMYYEYYFKDGVAYEKLGDQGPGQSRGFIDTLIHGAAGQEAPPLNRREYENDVIEDRFNDNYGYNLDRVGNSKYLIDSIDIFQVHGGKYSRTTLVNPRITGFNHDTLDYEDTTALVEMSFDFVYEGVVYANVNENLTDEELERYRYGDFWEMANLITLRLPVRGRKIESIPLPRVDTCGGGVIPISGIGLAQSPFFTAIGGIIGDRNVTRITDTIGGVVGSIPDAIGTVVSASIFGGQVSFNPDPRQALRSTGNQVGRSVVNQVRGNFAAAVASGASNILSGIFSSDGS